MYKNPVTIRCSSLDPLVACPPSILNPEGYTVNNPSNEAAERGTAIHYCAAEYVDTGNYDLKAACDMHGLEPDDDMASLMDYVVLAWDDLKQYFPTPKTEVIVTSDPIPFSHNGLTQFATIEGTADVLSPIGSESAVFVDWKTGYKDAGYHNQMFGYAYAIWCVLGKPEFFEVAGIVVFLRYRYYRIVRYTTSALKAWEYQLQHNVLPNPKVYKTGHQCKVCPIYASCPARKAMVDGVIDAFIRGRYLPEDDEWRKYIENAKVLLAGLTKENKDEAEVAMILDDLNLHFHMIDQAVKDAKQLVRSAVERVGPIDLKTGHVLHIREVKVRTLDPAKALPVARKLLSDTEIVTGMKLSLPQLTTMFASKHIRGEKGMARKQFEKEMEEAGAVNVAVQQRLELTDATPPEKTDGTATASNAGIGESNPRPSTST